MITHIPQTAKALTPNEKVLALSSQSLWDLSRLVGHIRWLAERPLANWDMRKSRALAEAEILTIQRELKAIGITKAHFPSDSNLPHVKLFSLCEAMEYYNSKRAHLLALDDGTHSKMSKLLRLCTQYGIRIHSERNIDSVTKPTLIRFANTLTSVSH